MLYFRKLLGFHIQDGHWSSMLQNSSGWWQIRDISKVCRDIWDVVHDACKIYLKLYYCALGNGIHEMCFPVRELVWVATLIPAYLQIYINNEPVVLQVWRNKFSNTTNSWNWIRYSGTYTVAEAVDIWNGLWIAKNPNQTSWGENWIKFHPYLQRKALSKKN